MVNIDERILDAFSENSREIAVRATFNNIDVIDGDYIISYEINESLGENSTLQLGYTPSRKLELQMYLPPTDILTTGYDKAEIKIEIGISIDGELEYIPLGVFYEDEHKLVSGKLTLTCYDKMLDLVNRKFNGNYVGSNVKASKVIKDICDYHNIDLGTFFDDGTGAAKQYHTDINRTGDVFKGEMVVDELPIVESTLTIKFGTIESWNPVGGFVYVYNSDKSALLKTIPLETREWEIFDDSVSWNIQLGVTGLRKPFIVEIEIDSPDFNKALLDIRFQNQDAFYDNTNIDSKLLNGIDCSNRVMLGYLAGLLGANAMIDRNGYMLIKPPIKTDIQVSKESQTFGGLSLNKSNELSADYLVTGTENKPVKYQRFYTDTDFGFNFTNPLFVETSDAIKAYQRYKDFPLKTVCADIGTFFNPCIELGDVVSIQLEDDSYVRLFVMQQKITVSGGVSSELSCDLNKDDKDNYKLAPVSDTIGSKFTSIEEAYNEVVSTLVGQSGGYVKTVYDSRNIPRALAITDSDITVRWDESKGKVVTDDGNKAMWVWSKGGLSYTKNGGGTYEVAINMLGQIYAEQIYGQLSKFVSLDAENGNIGGWSISKTALYKDYVYDEQTYRTYLQAPVTNPKLSYIISTQTKVTESLYNVDFYVTGDGELGCKRIVINSGVISSDNETYGLIFGSDIYASGKTVTCGNLIVNKGFDLKLENNSCIDAFTYNSELWTRVSSKLRVDGVLRLNDPSGSGQLMKDKWNNVYISSSSRRYKVNITDLRLDEFDINALYNLPIKQYEYIDDGVRHSPIDGKQIGIIAEDLSEVFPNACMYDADGNPENWTERILIPAMLKLIQDQKKQIDSLEERIEKLEKLIK